MIVVDTNIIVPLHLTSESTRQVLEILKKDASWCSPPLWRSEFLNVLAGCLHRKSINLDQATQIMEAALITMAGSEISISPWRVLELTLASSCTAYECEFVALAKELGLKLVTLDRQILAHFPETAIAPAEFINK
ncbi:MAG: type II toxin-antitoxin system VapC family toxin [Anaerolineales bacterium]|jgi:predicted nucleic acid-binding protein